MQTMQQMTRHQCASGQIKQDTCANSSGDERLVYQLDCQSPCSSLFLLCPGSSLSYKFTKCIESLSTACKSAELDERSLTRLQAMQAGTTTYSQPEAFDARKPCHCCPGSSWPREPAKFGTGLHRLCSATEPSKWL